MSAAWVLGTPERRRHKNSHLSSKWIRHPWPVRSSSVAVLDGQLSSLSASPHPRHEGRRPSAAGELRTGQGFAHVPVMLDEVLELFEGLSDGVVLDATVGGGGHADAILRQAPTLRLVGLDRDPMAVDAARRRLADFGHRVEIVQARFDDAAHVLATRLLGAPLVGALFDLGVSAPQLDIAARGFSFRADGPLDMRMDQTSGRSAKELLDVLDVDALASLLREHGETRFARRIAERILAARPIETTDALAEVVAAAVPAAHRRRGHPARRVFQALRVAVNEELAVLPGALDDVIELLSPGGRIVVLSYHSGEDRIVKERLAHFATGGCTCPPGLPCVCGARSTLRLLTRGARLPSDAEVAQNPRAEAARLRAAERTEPLPTRRSR